MSCAVSLVSLNRCCNVELATRLVLSHLSVSIDVVMSSWLQVLCCLTCLSH